MVRTRRINDDGGVMVVLEVVVVVIEGLTNAMDMVLPPTAGISWEAPMTTDKHKQAMVMTTNIK